MFSIFYHKCKQMYGLLPHYCWHIFFSLVTCCHVQWNKNAPTKNPAGRVFYKCFISKCKQVCRLLPHHYWLEFFVMHCCWRIHFLTRWGSHKNRSFSRYDKAFPDMASSVITDTAGKQLQNVSRFTPTQKQ